MKTLVMISLLLSPGLVSAARHRQSESDVYVSGHTKQDGTYVEPYYRSAPNANKWDNYDYKPSQPQYNPSANDPDRSPSWNTPNPGRFNDQNPNNDYPRN